MRAPAMDTLWRTATYAVLAGILLWGKPAYALPGPGDFTGDGLVDLKDHAVLVDCMTGPSVHSSAIECTCPDFDSDDDIDLDDLSAFLPSFGADYRPPGCEPRWARGFHRAGVGAHTLAAFDDGNGPALFVGGSFDHAWDADTFGIVRWDGYTWSELGGLGPYSPVIPEVPSAAAMTVYDDGTGPALYVGGSFDSVGSVSAGCIARWDGSSWQALGNGIPCHMGGSVRAIAAFDDGRGLALYAAGTFYGPANTSVRNIAKWIGGSWSDVGGGMGTSITAQVMALAVFDDGTGPGLYAAGTFTSAGGVEAANIAKWDGTSWSPLGSGVDGIVWSLAVFDAGSGPELYVGGDFATAGGIPVNSLAKWDGHAWSALGEELEPCDSYAPVSAMTVFDDGCGTALYVGGCFSTAGTVTANSIARWDGKSWSALGVGMGTLPGYDARINTMGIFDRGSGPALYVGGSFLYAGGVRAEGIARWDGHAWSALEGPRGIGANGTVIAFAVHDDGGGAALYAGGAFTYVEDVSANRIAKWDGQVWSPLGSGVNEQIRALESFDDGTGVALYAGGYFTTAGDVPVNRIAKWDGARWSDVGGGVDGDRYAAVHAMIVHDDGTGPGLYVGGNFTTAGGRPAYYVAKWDGTSWSDPGFGLRRVVFSLAVFDDGEGPELYAGTSVGVYKWDGSLWSFVGEALREPIYAFGVFDDGNGPALYAGWYGGLGRWDGREWTAVMPHPWDLHLVYALATVDDGSGPALYAGGFFFLSLGGVWMRHIARWDGCSWSPLDQGLDNAVYDLAIFDDGTGPALYVAGGFRRAGDTLSYGIAKWYRPAECDEEDPTAARGLRTLFETK